MENLFNTLSKNTHNLDYIILGVWTLSTYLLEPNYFLVLLSLKVMCDLIIFHSRKAQIFSWSFILIGFIISLYVGNITDIMFMILIWTPFLINNTNEYGDSYILNNIPNIDDTLNSKQPRLSEIKSYMTSTLDITIPFIIGCGTGTPPHTPKPPCDGIMDGVTMQSINHSEQVHNTHSIGLQLNSINETEYNGDNEPDDGTDLDENELDDGTDLDDNEFDGGNEPDGGNDGNDDSHSPNESNGYGYMSQHNAETQLADFRIPYKSLESCDNVFLDIINRPEVSSNSFTRRDLISYIPEIQERTDKLKSKTPEQSLSKLLQKFRDNGTLGFLGRGRYHLVQ